MKEQFTTKEFRDFLTTSIGQTDIKTRDSAQAALSDDSKKKLITKLLPFLGPAFIASVAYVDPGNFATNIQGGSEFGYTLLWVILASNLMAMLIQSLSAKLESHQETILPSTAGIISVTTRYLGCGG